MNNQFKIGDKVRLTAQSMGKHPEAFHGRLIVDKEKGTGYYVGVTAEGGELAGFFPIELEADGFRVDDRVEFKEDYLSRAKIGEQGVVVFVDLPDSEGRALLGVDMDNGEKEITVFDYRVKHAPEVVETVETVRAIEQEPEPQPVTYRICVDDKIGTTEYPSQAAAEQAAILHGNDGETFSIWETVMVADYRVKVTKSLEPVEAA